MKTEIKKGGVNLHKVLRGFRALKGLTQSDVAEKLGISVSAYSKKENGLVEFTLAEAVLLSELFGVEVAKLLPEKWAKKGE